MRIALVNVRYPLHEDADSIVFSPGRGVVYIGSESGVRRFEPAQRIDVDQRLVVPGLADAHMHLLSTALSFGRLDLRRVESIEELKEKVKAAASSAGRGEWIVGRGWDQDKMRERRYPTRFDLDEAAPENPVVLVRVCGHAAILNTLAMRELGLLDAGEKTGKFIHVEDGKPTGLVFEDLVGYALSKVPPPPPQRLREWVKRVLSEYLSYGVVSLHSMSASENELEIVDSLARSGELIQEYAAYIDYSEYASGAHRRYPHLVRGVKLFADGSFGARTAALREPYSDAGGSGSLLLSAEAIADAAARAAAEGLEVAVHAIGDRALEEVLNAKRKAGNIRVEHASLTPPDLLEEVASLRPVVSVQPHFLLSDTWIVDRLGDRTSWVYAFRSLLSAGAKLMGSSDSPVEPLNPWLGVYAAVERGREEGLPVYGYTHFEALSFRDAVRLYSEHTVAGGALVVLNVRDTPRTRGDFEKIRAETVITRKGVFTISKDQSPHFASA